MAYVNFPQAFRLHPAMQRYEEEFHRFRKGREMTQQERERRDMGLQELSRKFAQNLADHGYACRQRLKILAEKREKLWDSPPAKVLTALVDLARERKKEGLQCAVGRLEIHADYQSAKEEFLGEWYEASGYTEDVIHSFKKEAFDLLAGVMKEKSLTAVLIQNLPLETYPKDCLPSEGEVRLAYLLAGRPEARAAAVKVLRAGKQRFARPAKSVLYPAPEILDTVLEQALGKSYGVRP